MSRDNAVLFSITVMATIVYTAALDTVGLAAPRLYSTRETLLLTNEEVVSKVTQDVDLVIMPTERVEEVEAIMLLQYANDCEDLRTMFCTSMP